jgi:SAM-dependent methyltransferase
MGKRMSMPAMHSAPRAFGLTAYQRLLRVTFGVGLVLTVAIIGYTGGQVPGTALRALARVDLLLLLFGATVINLGVRFVRWQFLLRRAEVRRGIRETLAIYLAALGVSFVPLFAAEIALKGLLVGGSDREVQARGWTVALYDRLCDVVALSLCALAAAVSWGGATLSGRVWWVFVLAPLAFTTVRGRRAVAETARVLVLLVDRLLRGGAPARSAGFIDALVATPVTGVGIALGILAWAPVCLAAAVIVRASTGGALGWQAGPLFAAATLMGGVTLAPGGVGVTGLALGSELIRLGAPSAAAWASVAAIRASTFWFALIVGQVALARLAWRRPQADAHFDAVSDVYDAQLAPHIRALVVDRKIEHMVAALPPLMGLAALDIGCGLGWYLDALRARGVRVTGLDSSFAQARAARRSGGAVARASATALPFRTGSFDFAYAVNIIHHLEDREWQRQAFAEAARVLKPGGIFFLHEINVINPLFRFYMGYVFPLIKRIDEGTELWLNPDALPQVDGLRLEQVSYFTFLPDFLPRALMQSLLPLDRRLEHSRFARYSAHFMATLRREA